MVRILALILITGMLTACHAESWNNPYPQTEAEANVYYASFPEQPKTLDPARSYSSNEILFIGQIYEPPLQYDYLLRPYLLAPLTAEKIPEPVYLDKNNRMLSANTPLDVIAYSVYTVHIKPGIKYQPHPALATLDSNEAHHLLNTLSDFKSVGTRELIAEDYVYQIKRLAHPQLESPIFGLMSGYIVGLTEYQKTLQAAIAKLPKNGFLDLRQFPLEGVTVVDRYTYQIKIKGKYPQFIYWLAMPFFAPIPWEADYFYSRPGMEQRNITLNWYPIGTGPYQLLTNNPNREITLVKNPYFHGELFPSVAESTDKAAGFIKDAGKPLPFIDKFVFKLEKESIPRWNKFLHGYYDQSSISSDSFEQAIRVNEKGDPNLTPEMQRKNIRLQTSVATSSYYLGFNMLDDVVGGYSERARKLRQAIAIALDYEEYITIFLNGRGIPSQGPIPPGIFGHKEGKEGMNPYVYRWLNNKAQRRPLAEAKQLLSEAGYPNGREMKTNLPLILHYDVAVSGGPDEKSVLAWMRKQFAKLSIELQVRDTQYNRFQEKMRLGNAQIFFWGWSADYPDPENFLFLLYGPNAKVKFGGENAANYQNAEYDRLFEIMKNLPNGAERQAIIDQMLQIVRNDTPWVWAFYPKTFLLSHQWVSLLKPHEMANNTLKYLRIDPLLRAKERVEWNRPIVWPLIVLLLFVLLEIIPVVVRFWQKEHSTYRKRTHLFHR